MYVYIYMYILCIYIYVYTCVHAYIMCTMLSYNMISPQTCSLYYNVICTMQTCV